MQCCRVDHDAVEIEQDGGKWIGGGDEAKSSDSGRACKQMRAERTRQSYVSSKRYKNPHPNSLPEYKARGKEGKMRLPCLGEWVFGNSVASMCRQRYDFVFALWITSIMSPSGVKTCV
jgi:hypothetical protein